MDKKDREKWSPGGKKTMVKVFLVEDEAIIRHGIRDNIDWASHGFEFAGEAGDGEYAYPLILKAQPDILVTDINQRLSAETGILGGTHRRVEKGGGRDPGRTGKIEASGAVFCQLRKIYGISG